MIDHSRRVLIGADDLAIAIEQDPGKLVLLDVRWQVAGPSRYPDYLAGHLPGARWCDLDADLADPPGPGGRHPLPDPERLQARLRDWGVGEHSQVVVYDDGNSVAAARAWWVLRWAGLAQVRVLDGGLAAWLAGGHPVRTDLPRPATGTFSVRPGSLPVLDVDSAAAWAADGRLFDVRAPERYRGEIEPMDPVAGRIPGAANLPTTANLQPSGRFLTEPDLRQHFAEAGLPDGRTPIGVYCGSGVSAAHTVLTLHLAGIDAVLYPGSWSEWISDPDRPIATG